ncbi:MAG: DJ-1/PfpI family protein [Candidatus Marinimicrobia bacterium]|nr:DJ-1/PfpI family protein [Candidatus Neomarinimicrobiota bacterium]
MIKILVPLAPGLEEIEAIAIIDILRRSGATVVTAGLETRNILGSHQIPIIADELLENITASEYDGIVLPGGMPGTINLKNNDKVVALVQKFHTDGKLVAALCAAPMVLHQAGVLEGKKFTIHPGTKNEVPLQAENDQVVEDGNIVTGQASGAAILFSLTLVKKIFGEKKMEEVNRGVCYKF